jgi:hypothetical protein
MAARYCTKTTGDECASCAGWWITVLNISEPRGEAHTLVPRPRPVSCVLAVAVKPDGSVRRMLSFLES